MLAATAAVAAGGPIEDLLPPPASPTPPLLLLIVILLDALEESQNEEEEESAVGAAEEGERAAASPCRKGLLVSATGFFARELGADVDNNNGAGNSVDRSSSLDFVSVTGRIAGDFCPAPTPTAAVLLTTRVTRTAALLLTAPLLTVLLLELEEVESSFASQLACAEAGFEKFVLRELDFAVVADDVSGVGGCGDDDDAGRYDEVDEVNCRPVRSRDSFSTMSVVIFWCSVCKTTCNVE